MSGALKWLYICSTLTETQTQTQRKMNRSYTASEIRDKYQKLTKNDKIGVLHSALDYMQSYNGRSKLNCIALAMGYDTDGDGLYHKVCR